MIDSNKTGNKTSDSVRHIDSILSTPPVRLVCAKRRAAP